MGFEYEIKFDKDSVIHRFGLEENGEVQKTITSQFMTECEPYTPFASGDLIASCHVENDTDVVWSTPYAHYQYGGKVYVDPQYGKGGFYSPGYGWWSRPNVQKIPSDRDLQYKNAPRGSNWVDRAMTNGGLENIENAVKELIKKK